MSITEPVDLAEVDALVARLGTTSDAVLPLLQAVQQRYRYLPEPALQRICAITRITPAQIVGVASFYDQFRHRPAGEHRVQVCHGTACHVSGSGQIQLAIEQHLHLAAGEDTDADRRYTVERVACLGCCTLAPVVRIDQQTFGHLEAGDVAGMFARAARRRRRHPDAQPLTIPAETEIRVCTDSCCAVKGTDDLLHDLRRAASARGAAVAVRQVGCVGMCHQTPLVEVRVAGQPATLYSQLDPVGVEALVDRHVQPAAWWRRVPAQVNRFVDRLLSPPAALEAYAVETRDPQIASFWGPQVHIAMERLGELDPLDLEAYRGVGGFAGWDKARVSEPAALVELVRQSGLRGRGGGGFPTATKWSVARQSPDRQRYVICNGDEGDPGAFMDRMLLESFPYRVIEGLAIAARAVEAHDAIFYIRAEYPDAVQRITQALERVRQAGLLGDDLHITLRQGAGAFICGEETALIASIEGRRSQPTLRPPYPAQRGLWGHPTVVNNVETLALLPWILRHGPDAFHAIGTEHSTGTKVFALAGKVRRGGLIEVPMGMTIRDVVEHIGGGTMPGRTFKAVQIGGPSGGCIPASLADTPIDYEALRERGAIMGSGGLVVLDDRDCMVDLARYFLHFTQAQSCGQCTFCRVGTRRMLDILIRLTEGQARRDDLDELEHLAQQVQRGSLCGLGATAPNPVLTTLRYFRDEYEAHLAGRCPAGRCAKLIRYQINDRCVGCTLCAQHCPADAIPATPYRLHTIDAALCTRCDACRVVCPHDAVEVVSP